VPIPKEINCIAMIPVCAMTKTPHPKMAEKYIMFLLTEGKKIFAQFGFKVAK